MTETWHATADLANLPGMPGVRGIRLRGADRGWISRKTKRGARTVLEWAESSLPPETRAALIARRDPGADTGVPTGGDAPGTATEGDDAGVCSPPSSPSPLSDSPAVAVADARAEAVAAFKSFRASSGLALVPAFKAFARAWPGDGVSDGTRALVPSLSWSTLRRWHNAHARGGTAALISGRGGRRSDVADDPALAGFSEAMLFDNPYHLTARNLRRAIAAEWPDREPPGIASVRRFMARWRDENGFEISAVADPDGHRSRTMPAYGKADWDVTALNQLWELDSTRLDVTCADGRRWDVVVALEVWSRRMKALVTQRSSAEAITALVRRCLLDWGVPGAIRSDEGRDYTSNHLRRVLRDLEVEHDILPPYRPDLKPFVERAIGKLSHDHLTQLPGFSGHSVADAERIRGRKSFAARRGEDNVVRFACALTAEQLQESLDGWCDDIHGREPHAGLDGLSPFDRVASWTGEPPKTVSEHGMSVLMAPAAGDGRRKVSKKAISVDGGRYMAGELGKWADQWVHVRQDPDDLGRIFVFTEADAAGRHAFICIAEDPARTGIDRREVAVEARRGWSARTSAARKRARDLKREHAPHEAIEAVLEKARQDAGKVVPLKPKGDEHATPATESAKAAEAAKDAAPESRRRRVNDPDRITQLWGENL